MSCLRVSYLGDGESVHREAVREEVRNVVEFLDARTGGDWEFHDYGDYDPSGGNEREYVTDAINAMEAETGDDYPIEGEVVVVPHGAHSWGYGANRPLRTDGDVGVYGAAVYAGYAVDEKEARIMTWHEAGHSWVSTEDHSEHGDASVVCCDDGAMHSITPMAAAYVRDKYGFPYMRWPSKHDPPADFCWYTENGQGTAEWFGHTEGSFVSDRYSWCTMNDAEGFIDYHC